MALKDSEQKKLLKLALETQDVYEFLVDLERDGKIRDWPNDAERFIALTSVHTKALVGHSITLTKLTWALIGLSIALFLSALGHIFLILESLNVFNLFR
jgi:hypothetical protein